jgi:hypothetical protein
MKKNLVWALALALGGVVGAVGCELAAEQGAPCTEDADCEVATGEACTDPDGDGSTNCNCGCDLNVGACDDLNPAPGTQSTDPCPCDEECGAGAGGNGGGCAFDGDCPNGFFCAVNGTCQPDGGNGGGAGQCTTDAQCGAGMMCMGGVCVNAAECTTSADCMGGDDCINGSCVPATADCMSDNDCGPDEICQAGFCIPAGGGCTSNLDCFPGESCQGGVCIPDQTGCTSNAECAAGETCIGGDCVPTGSSDCEAACTNLYAVLGCGLQGINTEQECVDMVCAQGGFGGADACIAAMPECTQAAFDACTGGGGGCTTDADCGGGATCQNGQCVGGQGGPCTVDPNGADCAACADPAFQACASPGGSCANEYGAWEDCLLTNNCVDQATGSVNEGCMTQFCAGQTEGLGGCLNTSCPDLAACY